MKKGILIGLSIILASCANYYKEAPRSAPHATIIFERQSGVGGAFGGMEVTPLEINGKAPNEWNKWDFHSFRVAPGRLVVFVQAEAPGRVVGLGFLKFVAVDGETYTISRSLLETTIRIVARASDGSTVADITVKKAIAQPGMVVPVMIPTS